MAGDFDTGPNLGASCLNNIAANFELFMKQYPRRNESPSSFSCHDRGFSGSMLVDAAPSSDKFNDCTLKPTITSEIQGTMGVPENIASLEMQCHHDPPCGTVQKQSSKSANPLIPPVLSESIQKSVCKRGKMNDAAATYFSDNSLFQFKKLYLKKAGLLSVQGMKTLLGKHVLTELNAASINAVRTDEIATSVKKKKNITVSDVVSSLNSKTKERLMYLNISGIASEAEDWIPLAIYHHASLFKKLTVLTNVRSLNVSHTNFTDNDFNTVIGSMKHLQCLDISQTPVRSIGYLRDIDAPKLRSLTMYNLEKLQMSRESLFEVFCKMNELRHLDISMERRTVRNIITVEQTSNTNDAIGMMMVGSYPLPNLISLDISGREGIEEHAFSNFLVHHQHLIFLGLLQTGLNMLPCFTNEKHHNFKNNIKVTGDHNESQILESLSRYHRRSMFVRQALLTLFSHTHNAPQYNKEQFELVLRCMRSHRDSSDSSSSVQMAATACVYNLTNREMGLKIPLHVLAKVISEILITMEIFQGKQQLQKNCLLTLCSDRVLKEVKFNYFKTAKLVMQCLCTHEDAAMHRMCVAIISILAAKISTEETAILGCSNYMKMLLQIVKMKLGENAFDLTLKFTLSALWNLTDESPPTCQNFIDNDGLQLFVDILKVNNDNPCLQTKVLGLLNNLAEVPSLRLFLLNHGMQLISLIRGLLSSKHIEVSYFAAGIVSHLSLLDEEDWVEFAERNFCVGDYRRDLLKDLYDSVLQWSPPDGEMVAYRTLKPFFPLLERHDMPETQLWAAWAIRHVCTKNGRKYQEMLISENGIECLIQVKENIDLDLKVCEIIDSILDVVQKDFHLAP